MNRHRYFASRSYTDPFCHGVFWSIDELWSLRELKGLIQLCSRVFFGEIFAAIFTAEEILMWIVCCTSRFFVAINQIIGCRGWLFMIELAFLKAPATKFYCDFLDLHLRVYWCMCIFLEWFSIVFLIITVIMGILISFFLDKEASYL